jgi:thiol-disulfide isomerase/thioredoxin
LNLKQMKAFNSIILCVLILSGQAFAYNRENRIYPNIESLDNPFGLPILLDFFSITCSSCYDELFEMKLFIEENDLNIMLVGVTCELETELETFLKKYSFHYPVINDIKMKIYRRFKAYSPFKIVLQDNQVLYQDDSHEDIVLRREKAKIWLKNQFSK